MLYMLICCPTLRDSKPERQVADDRKQNLNLPKSKTDI